MLSNKFKKQLKDLLYHSYGIECYRIVSNYAVSYHNYTNFKLNCMAGDKSVTLTLNTFIDRSDMDNYNVGSFNVFIPVLNLDDLSIVSHHVDSEPMYSMLHSVCETLVPFIEPFNCVPVHNKISIIHGHFNYEKGLCNITDIAPFIETTSSIFYKPSFGNPFSSDISFCNFHIIDKEITVDPIKVVIDNKNHFLSERYPFNEKGLNSFKALLIKSFIFFEQSKYRSASSFSDLNTSDIFHATPEELEQILILAHMQKI
jgi:hypothetical protein